MQTAHAIKKNMNIHYEQKEKIQMMNKVQSRLHKRKQGYVVDMFFFSSHKMNLPNLPFSSSFLFLLLHEELSIAGCLCYETKD